MEFVDIVDEDNKVIGKTSKEEAHVKGFLHRTAIAEVFNSKGEWLLVQQAGHKQDAGQFVSPVGGHVSAGETEEEALKRETHEEIGLKDFTYQFKGKAIYNRVIKDKKENHYFIVYEIQSDMTPKLNDESVHYKWFSLEEIKKTLKEDPKKFGEAFHFVWNTFYFA